MIRASIAAAALAVLWPQLAAADDLPGPPEECPPGSTPHTEHAGQWCAATTCQRDADCTATSQRARHGVHLYGEERYVCREVSLCVRHETYELGGNLPEPRSSERDVAVGACVEARCPAGGDCTTLRRCVLAEDAASLSRAGTPASDEGGGEGSGPAAAGAEEEESSSGCAVARRASPLPAIAALGVLGWLLRRRR